MGIGKTAKTRFLCLKALFLEGGRPYDSMGLGFYWHIGLANMFEFQLLNRAAFELHCNPLLILPKSHVEVGTSSRKEVLGLKCI